jgi:hypothetical protein
MARTQRLKGEMNPIDKPTVSDAPKFLYHYTSIQGVEGILNTKSVWATQLHFMNDSTEWLYALDLVRENLEDTIALPVTTAWLEFVAEARESLKRIEGIEICVCSFSEVSNQLSQWRAYGGYEVTFDVAELEVILRRYEFQLKPCIYDPEEQRRIIDGIVRPIIADRDSITDEQSLMGAANDLQFRLARELAVVAPVLKHPDFKEEKEWRAFGIVHPDDPHMSYHIRGAVIVPHCNLELKAGASPTPLREIKVGPHPHQSLAVQGLKILTRHSQIGVTASSTPFRTF